MIQVHSPYTKDAEDIRHRLEQLQKSHTKLDEHMDQQSDDLHAVRGDVQEIKAILRERPRRPE